MIIRSSLLAKAALAVTVCWVVIPAGSGGPGARAQDGGGSVRPAGGQSGVDAVDVGGVDAGPVSLGGVGPLGPGRAVLPFPFDFGRSRHAGGGVAGAGAGGPRGGLDLRLPFPCGESWILTRGYNTATHSDIDVYALDFTLNGCDAWQRPILAAAGGTVTYAAGNPANTCGGELTYGLWVEIDHGSGYRTLYGHLDSTTVSAGQNVSQGTQIGRCGNAGYACGSACPTHPGAHVHFRLTQNGVATVPEPMSGYSGFTPGSSYLSDNACGPAGEDNASFISSTIPDALDAGQGVTVEVVFENTGTSTWTRAGGYALGAVGGSDPFANAQQQLGPGDSIAPGQRKTFTFSMAAPTTPGAYVTDWQMVRSGVTWFGQIHSKTVSVAGADQSTTTWRDYNANWNGAWGDAVHWDYLAGSDPFPDNTPTHEYGVYFPAAGAPYIATVGSSNIELKGLSLHSDATLRLSSSGFKPGLLTNDGTIEIREDGLTLDQSPTNNGVLRFDSDPNGEHLRIQTSMTLNGGGALRFPDIASPGIAHVVYIEASNGTLTNGASHVIEGGGGVLQSNVYGATQTFANDGVVRANLPGRTLQFSRYWYSGFNLINNNRMSAEDGGILEFNQSSSLVNNGTLSCDDESTLLFSSSGTLTISSTVDCDGLCQCNASTIVFDGATGQGTGEYRQTSGGSTTFALGATLEFGSVDIQAGSLTVQGGGFCTVRDRFNFTLTDENAFNFSTTGALRVIGGTGAGPSDYGDFAEIEIGGRDLGVDPDNHYGYPDGFINNFHLARLIIGPGAKVNLIDEINNGNRCGVGGSSEALYVDQIVFEDGNGRLNTNGLHLYFNTLTGDAGQIISSGGKPADGMDCMWTCANGNWASFFCWTSLGTDDAYPNNNFTEAYQVTLPSATPYTVTVNVGPIDLCSLDVSSSATLRLDGASFQPGVLNNDGTIEVRNENLYLDTNVSNDGVIRFDSDANAEYVRLRSSVSFSGTGFLRFPDIATTGLPHYLFLDGPNSTAINGVGHTIEGGGGIIQSSAYGATQTFINDGVIRANLSGRTLQFARYWYAGFSVTNNNLMAAESGGTLEFSQVSTLVNAGSLQCTSGSTLLFSGGGSHSLGSSVQVDGLMRNDASTIVFDGTQGGGGGEFRQTNGGNTTWSLGTTVEFGTVDIQSGSVSVLGGGLMTIRDRYTHNLTDPNAHNFNTTAGLRVVGGTTAGPSDYDNFARIEIAGRDLGVDPVNHFGYPDGFIGNFHLPRLIIGPGAKVSLVDLINNGSRCGVGGAAEALYVDQVVFQDGNGRLNLNGLHLYYNALSGSTNQIVDSGGQSSAGIGSTWTCANGNWGAFFCWDRLGAGDGYPNNFFTAAYQVFLPTRSGNHYTVTVNSGPVEICSLNIDSDATLRLDGSNFDPKELTNRGIIEVRNDNLYLNSDVANDGIIRFDSDANAEYIRVRKTLALQGNGSLRFPDAGSDGGIHFVYLDQPGSTLTNAAGHTIEGGGGGVFSSAYGNTQTFINDGAVLADLTDRTLQFNRYWYAGFNLVNNGLMSATNGGRIDFSQPSSLISEGEFRCDADSRIVFNSGGSLSIGGTVNCDGLFQNNGNSLIFYATGGGGTGEYRQSSYGSTTFTLGTTVSFGAVNIEAGSLAVQDGGRLTTGGRFSHRLTDENAFNFSNTAILRITGGIGGNVCGPSDTLATIEAASRDMGTDPDNHVGDAAGFNLNFHISKLVIAAGAKVLVVDEFDNGRRNGVGGTAEALYVDTLQFEDGTGRLVLGGRHLYYNRLIGGLGQIGLGADCNGNNRPDDCDITEGYSRDCNANGVPDECDVGGGGGGPITDCNNNGVPDGCDIDSGTSQDCQSNGVPDLCEISAGSSNDLNGNNRPDECETDCNSNSVPDDEDVSGGASEDCNGNGMPDECEVGFDTFTWIGASDGSFTQPQNWDQGRVPGGDVVMRNAGAAVNRSILDRAGRQRVCGLLVEASGAGKQILRIDSAATLFAARDATINAGGEINLQGGQLLSPTVTNRGNSLRGYGFVDGEVVNEGLIEPSSGQTLTVRGSELDNRSSGVIRCPVAGVLSGQSDSMLQDGRIEVWTGGAAVFADSLENMDGGLISLLGGSLGTGGVVNQVGGDINGFGGIGSNLDNDGDMAVIADMQIIGDLNNDGMIVIQSGILTITGNLGGSGSIIGDFGGGRGGDDGLTVIGDLGIAAGGSLRMTDGVVRAAGNVDLAIDDSSRFDMATGELQLVGLPGEPAQELEAMAADAGGCGGSLPNAALFSIRRLRIGPSQTRVMLVDRWDNTPGSGAEAIYVEELSLEPGVTLDLNGLRIYYSRVTPADPMAPGSGVTVVDSFGGGGLISLGGGGGVPAITQQPQGQIVCAGASVTFQVAAQGGGLTYQWRRNGVGVSGATSDTLVLNSAQLADAGNYDVEVRNGCGQTISDTASLIVWAGSAGDVNGDGVVDGRDVAFFLAVLRDSPNGPAGLGFCSADMNADGRVDAADVPLLIAALVAS